MSDRETVIAAHSQAYIVPFGVGTRWKVYANRRRFIALSASQPTKAAAWADAARGVRERVMRQGQQQQGAK